MTLCSSLPPTRSSRAVALFYGVAPFRGHHAGEDAKADHDHDADSDPLRRHLYEIGPQCEADYQNEKPYHIDPKRHAHLQSVDAVRDEYISKAVAGLCYPVIDARAGT